MKKRALIIILLAILLIVADQLLKFWVKTHMYLGEELPLCGQWFKLHFIENEGMAFGMAFGGMWGKFLLTSFRILAAVIIAYLCILMVKQKVSWGLLICSTLIFSGAVGNIIDCIFYGKIFSESIYYGALSTIFPPEGGYAPWLQGRVVDMIQFDLFTIHFPESFPIWSGQYFNFFPAVFNLADSWITIGLFAMIIFFYKPLSLFVNSMNKKKQ